MKFFVYILKSLVDNTLYTGYTSNIEKRLHEHNSGKSRYTKSKIPYKILHIEEYSTRSEAIKREKFLKSGKGREILKEILDNIT